MKTLLCALVLSGLSAWAWAGEKKVVGYDEKTGEPIVREVFHANAQTVKMNGADGYWFETSTKALRPVERALLGLGNESDKAILAVKQKEAAEKRAATKSIAAKAIVQPAQADTGAQAYSDYYRAITQKNQARQANEERQRIINAMDPTTRAAWDHAVGMTQSGKPEEARLYWANYLDRLKKERAATLAKAEQDARNAEAMELLRRQTRALESISANLFLNN